MVCRLLGLTIVVVLLAHSPVHAQVSVLDTFRDYLESLRVQAGIPGLAVAVISQAEVSWEHAFGSRTYDAPSLPQPTRPSISMVSPSWLPQRWCFAA